MYLKYFLFLILLATCNSTSDVNAEDSESAGDQNPTRRQLIRKQYDLKEISVITPALKMYAGLEEKMGNQIGRDISLNYHTIENWKNKPTNDKAIFLIGSIAEHNIIQDLIPQLPFKWQQQNIEFADQLFKTPSTILKISLFPNPKNPKLPIYLLTGHSDQHIIDFIEEKYDDRWNGILFSSFGYQVYENNACTMSGFFSENNWVVDKKLHWNFSNSQLDTLSSPHFNFINHQKTMDKNKLEILATTCEATCSEIASFFNKDFTKKIDYHIYPDMETKGMMRSKTSHSHIVSKKDEVHAVHAPAFMGNELQQENKLIIQDLFDSEVDDWIIEGLSIYFAPKWQRFGYRHWAKKLLTSDNMPNIEQLMDSELIGFESHIVLGAGKASLVDYLINHWGREKFISQAISGSINLSVLNKYRDNIYQHILNYKYSAPTIDKKPLPYLRGFNFAHEGYQIFNGYGSKLAAASLQATQSLGANTSALVPYSYMRNHQAPSPIPIVDHPGSETDESVIHSIYHAKVLGMHTMLKPQLWLGHSWTGFIEMKSPLEWKQFFDHYLKWIRHYALLAEIYEVDVFSVGVEFVQATLQNESAWKNIFEKIRPLYSGQITYCANWGDEFEKLNFWESLDFIGLNCYYPIGNGEAENQKTLTQNFAAVTRKIEGIARKHNKQIVFTEIGFRSVTAPWKNPHAEANNRPFNEHNQAACYRAVFENIKDKPWCNGILWWKWPCNLGHRGPGNTGFSPAGKTTELVIEEWFKK